MTARPSIAVVRAARPAATGPVSAPASVLAAGVSVVLPAYNEEANLAATVTSMADALRRFTSRFEILVVDDGSDDRTPQVASSLAARQQHIALVRHAENRGYGAALRTGFARARHPWVFFTDADGQFDPEEIVRLEPLAADADIVAGYRLRRRDPWYRRAGGVLFGRVLVRSVLGVRARDLNCAFKLIRRPLLTGVELKANGALINAELFWHAQRVGARIVEVGVSHRPRRAGVPTGGRPTVALRALRELLALRRDIGSR